MNPGDRSLLPVACTLSAADGAVQLDAWRMFNDDYQLEVDREPGSITVHYAKVDDAVTRITELVRTERSCCASASWRIDATHGDLRLHVTAADDALQALTFLAGDGQV